MSRVLPTTHDSEAEVISALPPPQDRSGAGKASTGRPALASSAPSPAGTLALSGAICRSATRGRPRTGNQAPWEG